MSIDRPSHEQKWEFRDTHRHLVTGARRVTVHAPAHMFLELECASATLIFHICMYGVSQSRQWGNYAVGMITLKIVHRLYVTRIQLQSPLTRPGRACFLRCVCAWLSCAGLFCRIQYSSALQPQPMSLSAVVVLGGYCLVVVAVILVMAEQ